MNTATLKAAKAEALRFVKRINELESVLTPKDSYLCGGKQTGAVKRASMDLSRALSEMRKPG